MKKKVENSFSVFCLVQGILRPDLIKRSDQWVSKRQPNGSEEVYDMVPKDEAEEDRERYMGLTHWHPRDPD